MLQEGVNSSDQILPVRQGKVMEREDRLKFPHKAPDVLPDFPRRGGDVDAGAEGVPHETFTAVQVPSDNSMKNVWKIPEHQMCLSAQRQMIHSSSEWISAEKRCSGIEINRGSSEGILYCMRSVASMATSPSDDICLKSCQSKLPHACSIPGGLSIGSKIYIHGMVPKDSSRFSVNLQRGADEDTADIYYHFSPRFGDTPVVVRNTRSSGKWGVEEREGLSPFTVSCPFILVITAFLGSYESEVNGSSTTTFKIRDGLPLSSVTHLAIEGEVIIWAIHKPVESMPRNLRLSIPGRIKVGDMVFLRGAVPAGAQKFVINVQCGPGKTDDIVFHFNPRISDGVVVRNSRIDDQWGSEESEGSMPFTEGQKFLLVMSASSNGFDTWVDGKEFVRFVQRQDMNTASTLFVEGDLYTEDIVIDCAQCQLPPQCDDGVKRKSDNARLQVFLPELPLVSRITGGLDKGCIFILSGVVAKEPTGFHVNLQCDSSEDSDIALHYNPRWKEIDPVLVLNSREDEKWGSEVRVKEDRLILSPGLHFDLVIFAAGENFCLSVNGVHQADFPMRLEQSKADHVTVEGSVIVHRLLVV